MGNDVQIYFARGEYQKVLESIETSTKERSEHWTMERVASLVFTGDLNQAWALYKKYRPSLGEEDKAGSLFYLLIGQTRVSQYLESQETLRTLLVVSRADRSSDLTRFYALQGLAFFHYFRGHFARTLRLSRYALQRAYFVQSPALQILCLDLLGHTHIQQGHVRRGLQELERARSLAQKIGHQGHSQAIGMSLHKYNSYFLAQASESIAALEKALDQLQAEDNYSRNELNLELISETLLSGDYLRARQLIQKSYVDVYAIGHRRQIAKYNLKFALLHYLEGDFYASLNLLQSAKLNIVEAVDTHLRVQLLTLEAKVLKAVQRQTHLNAHSESLKELSRSLGSQLNLRILKREGLLSLRDACLPVGEDPKGDLIDLARKGPSTAPEIDRSGYLSLLMDACQLEPGVERLAMGLVPQVVFSFSSQGVYAHRQITSLLRRILVRLAEGPTSHQQLIEEVWGYTYDPLMHDPLIHRAIARLRKALDRQSHWIVSQERSYRLEPHVQLVVFQHKEITTDTPVVGDNELRAEVAAPAPQNWDLLRSDMNGRQWQLICGHKQGDLVSPGDYRSQYSVSAMTAYRDLNDLVSKGFLLRLGQGRATMYLVNREGKT